MRRDVCMGQQGWPCESEQRALSFRRAQAWGVTMGLLTASTPSEAPRVPEAIGNLAGI